MTAISVVDEAERSVQRQAPADIATGGTASLLLSIVLKAGKSLGLMAISAAVALGLWQGALSLLHLNPYFAKSPLDVWRYLFEGPASQASRHLVISALLVTVRDASLGYVFGTLAAVIVSISVVMRRSVEQTLMPIAIALRSVPLVALTPLIALAFGRGLAAVAVISGIVTFFPSLVNVVQGLRSAPSLSFDLMAAYGASELTVLRKVRLPNALPSLFTSARIAAPGALLGAVLAEWLATGNGLGYLMLTSSSDSQFDTLWAGVVLITLVSVAIYNLVSAVERPILARFGPA